MDTILPIVRLVESGVGLSRLLVLAVLIVTLLILRFLDFSTCQTDKLKLNHCYITRDRKLRRNWTTSQSKQKERFEDEEEEEDWNDGVQDI